MCITVKENIVVTNATQLKDLLIVIGCRLQEARREGHQLRVIVEEIDIRIKH
jgi:hypothetical protein